MTRSHLCTASTRLVALVALVALISAGCAEPNAPAHVIQSIYVAESVNGEPLPVELVVFGTTHRYLEATTIAFESGAEARRIQRIRSVDTASNGLTVVTTDTAYFDVTVSGDTTWLHARCMGPAATCIAPLALLRVGETFQVAISYDPLRTMTLVRQ